MMSGMHTTSEAYDFKAGIEQIIAELQLYYPHFNERREEKVRKAYWYSFDAHKEQKRFSGEPYFMHPVEATKILLTIRPDVDTVCACLLHDVIEDTPITADEIEETFGQSIRFLCEGVEKVSKVNLRDDQRGQKLETLKKLFLAVAQDIRVIFVKLADRIHNLQTLDHVRPQKRQRIAQESQKIYAPIAQKLGLFAFKNQIEDLCFQHLHPAVYAILQDELAAHFVEQETFIRRAKKAITEELKAHKIPLIEITGRRKNIASIYSKMKRKNLHSVSEVYDLVGFRIVTKKDEMCYRILGALHRKWTPMVGRFKDYVSVPKPNGYQSLHTTLLGLSGSKVPTEIQIRTEKMNLDAEYGPAAHWAYKTKRSSNFDEDYVKRTEWFPTEIARSHASEKPADEFYDQITQSVLDDRIYVFTPKGDPISLQVGASAVDFAYAVHTQVGHTIVGAKINGVMRPISTQLENGQIVEILTKKSQVPREAWLSFVKTSTARQAINAHLNRQRKAEQMPVKNQLNELKTQVQKLRPMGIKPKPNEQTRLIIGGEGGIPHRLASCCSPKTSDELVAYKSRGLQFLVHKADCDELRKLLPERMLSAEFIAQRGIKIVTQNRVALLRDVLDVLAESDVSIADMQLNTLANKDVPQSEIELLLDVNTTLDWPGLLRKIDRIKGIHSLSEVKTVAQ